MRSQARASRGRADRSRMITGTEVVQDLVTAMGASGAEESRGAHSTAETQRGGGKRGEDLERTGRSWVGRGGDRAHRKLWHLWSSAPPFEIQVAEVRVGLIEAGDAAVIGARGFGIETGLARTCLGFAHRADAVYVGLLFDLARADLRAELFGGGEFVHGSFRIGERINVDARQGEMRVGIGGDLPRSEEDQSEL